MRNLDLVDTICTGTAFIIISDCFDAKIKIRGVTFTSGEGRRKFSALNVHRLRPLIHLVEEGWWK